MSLFSLAFRVQIFLFQIYGHIEILCPGELLDTLEFLFIISLEEKMLWYIKKMGLLLSSIFNSLNNRNIMKWIKALLLLMIYVGWINDIPSQWECYNCMHTNYQSFCASKIRSIKKNQKFSALFWKTKNCAGFLSFWRITVKMKLKIKWGTFRRSLGYHFNHLEQIHRHMLIR